MFKKQRGHDPPSHTEFFIVLCHQYYQHDSFPTSVVVLSPVYMTLHGRKCWLHFQAAFLQSKQYLSSVSREVGTEQVWRLWRKEPSCLANNLNKMGSTTTGSLVTILRGYFGFKVIFNMKLLMCRFKLRVWKKIKVTSSSKQDLFSHRFSVYL